VFVSTIMIGRDLKGFAARDHILCSTDGHPGVGEDDLTKSFFARTGKLILMHGKSQSMHSVPVHQPHRPADGGRQGIAIMQMKSKRSVRTSADTATSRDDPTIMTFAHRQDVI
jgi:hypothetical protein